MRKSIWLGCAAVATVGALAAGTAMATPGVNAPTPEPNPPITGVLDGPSKARKDRIELKVGGDTTVRSFTLRYVPGSNSGWHRHPGIVVAVVESGEVIRRLENDCRKVTFKAGEAFTEVAGHFVANESTSDAVLRITQFVPRGADPLREDILVNPCPRRT